MILKEAEELAKKLMFENGLLAWDFHFTKAKRVFGSCYGRREKIVLSSLLVSLNSKDRVKDTILHEIAHALTPGAGHGRKWKLKCIELGCSPERCYDDTVIRPKSKYTLTCPNCSGTVNRGRKTNKGSACRICCNELNNGNYNPKFKFIWSKNY